MVYEYFNWQYNYLGLFDSDLQGSPGLAPSRVSQLRQEGSNCADWESASEKEFHGNANIAQSWEDLSLVYCLF